jgi:hypothetical protein
MATMPFMNPFMMPMMGQGMGADPMMGMMMARIEELEKRIKALEKKPTAKTKTKKKD